MSKVINSTIVKRKFQLYSFITLCVVNIGLVVAVVTSFLPPLALGAIIPFLLIMGQNIKMWDLYNDIYILQKCMFDKEYLDNYKKENDL